MVGSDRSMIGPLKGGAVLVLQAPPEPKSNVAPVGKSIWRRVPGSDAVYFLVWAFPFQIGKIPYMEGHTQLPNRVKLRMRRTEYKSDGNSQNLSFF